MMINGFILISIFISLWYLIYISSLSSINSKHIQWRLTWGPANQILHLISGTHRKTDSPLSPRRVIKFLIISLFASPPPSIRLSSESAEYILFTCISFIVFDFIQSSIAGQLWNMFSIVIGFPLLIFRAITYKCYL